MNKKLIVTMLMSYSLIVSAANYAEVNFVGDNSSTYGINIMSNFSDFSSRDGVKLNLTTPTAGLELNFKQVDRKLSL